MVNAGHRIGFLGTGIMGFPMARRLAESGCRVHAWNRSPEKAAPLAAFGASVEERATEAVRDAQTVLCMLNSGQVCDEVLLGQGVLETIPSGTVLVVMSSIPVETARSHAAAAATRGIGALDAPVSGGEIGARNGSLAIMAGGDAADFERVRPVLELLGRPVLVGPSGTGQLAKLVNQLIVASTIASVAEAMLLAERGGADPGKVREALCGGFADSPILRTHAPRMIARHFQPGGTASNQIKDTGTALAFARSLGLDLPVGSLVDRLFTDLVRHGDGELDHSALVREIRRRNKLPPD